MVADREGTHTQEGEGDQEEVTVGMVGLGCLGDGVKEEDGAERGVGSDRGVEELVEMEKDV